MKNRAVAFGVAAVLAMGATTSQAKLIKEISAAGMDVEFTPGGVGGTLTVSAPVTTAFIKFDDDTQTTIENASWTLETTLTSDNSTGDGLAEGMFAGGSVMIKDSADAEVFSATIETLELKEAGPAPGSNVLLGAGSFSSGVLTLPPHTFVASGAIFSSVFSASIDIEDFAQAFTATGGVIILPEPTTMALLGVALLAGGRRRRRRRIRR